MRRDWRRPGKRISRYRRGRLQRLTDVHSERRLRRTMNNSETRNERKGSQQDGHRHDCGEETRLSLGGPLHVRVDARPDLDTAQAQAVRAPDHTSDAWVSASAGLLCGSAPGCSIESGEKKSQIRLAGSDLPPGCQHMTLGAGIRLRRRCGFLVAAITEIPRQFSLM
jgi:hypothetical protein